MAGTEGSVYTPNPKKHKCQICGMVFETAYMLSYHKALEHSGEGDLIGRYLNF